MCRGYAGPVGPPCGRSAVPSPGATSRRHIDDADTGCSISTLSTLGPPAAVVAVARIVLSPKCSGVTRVLVSQSFQAGVLSKARPGAMVVPLTAMSIGRPTVVALAYQRFRAVGQVHSENTVHC